MDPSVLFVTYNKTLSNSTWQTCFHVWSKSTERPRRMSNCRWGRDQMHSDLCTCSRTEKFSLKRKMNLEKKIMISIIRVFSDTDHKLGMRLVLWLIMRLQSFHKMVVKHLLFEVGSCQTSLALPHRNLVSVRDHLKPLIILTCFQSIKLKLNKLEWLMTYSHLNQLVLRKLMMEG